MDILRFVLAYPTERTREFEASAVQIAPAQSVLLAACLALMEILCAILQLILFDVRLCLPRPILACDVLI